MPGHALPAQHSPCRTNALHRPWLSSAQNAEACIPSNGRHTAHSLAGWPAWSNIPSTRMWPLPSCYSTSSSTMASAGRPWWTAFQPLPTTASSPPCPFCCTRCWTGPCATSAPSCATPRWVVPGCTAARHSCACAAACWMHWLQACLPLQLQQGKAAWLRQGAAVQLAPQRVLCNVVVLSWNMPDACRFGLLVAAWVLSTAASCTAHAAAWSPSCLFKVACAQDRAWLRRFTTSRVA